MASLASEEEDDDDEEAIRSTVLKPTAPMARTTRRESNSATGFAVADEIILATEDWPPARGMERASDLAADPESERDSSVLLVRDTAREAGDEPTTDVGWGNAKAAPHANVDVRRRVARQRDMVFSSLYNFVLACVNPIGMWLNIILSSWSVTLQYR